MSVADVMLMQLAAVPCAVSNLQSSRVAQLGFADAMLMYLASVLCASLALLLGSSRIHTAMASRAASI